MLILTRKPGEAIVINDNIRVIVLGMKGNQIRLGVEAPTDVPVHREDIQERIKAESAA